MPENENGASEGIWSLFRASQTGGNCRTSTAYDKRRFWDFRHISPLSDNFFVINCHKKLRRKTTASIAPALLVFIGRWHTSTGTELFSAEICYSTHILIANKIASVFGGRLTKRTHDEYRKCKRRLKSAAVFMCVTGPWSFGIEAEWIAGWWCGRGIC